MKRAHEDSAAVSKPKRQRTDETAEADVQSDKTAALYEKIVGRPLVSDGFMLQDRNTLLLETTVKDIATDKTKKLYTNFRHSGGADLNFDICGEEKLYLGGGSHSFEPEGFPACFTDVVAYCPSPSSSKLALLRKLDAAQSTDKLKHVSQPRLQARARYVLEVFEGGALLLSIPTGNAHGRAYTSQVLAAPGGLVWSSDEQFLLYVAESSLPAVRSVFRTPDEEEEKKATLKGNKYRQEQDLGEQLNGAERPGLFVVSVQHRGVRQLKLQSPFHAAVGQAVWVPDEECGVVFTAWSQRLGLVYHNTRASQLCYVKPDLDALFAAPAASSAELRVQPLPLPEADHSPMGACFSPDGKKLLYLTTDRTPCHISCSRLQMLAWRDVITALSSGAALPPVTVVPVVKTPETRKHVIYCTEDSVASFAPDGAAQHVVRVQWPSDREAALHEPRGSPQFFEIPLTRTHCVASFAGLWTVAGAAGLLPRMPWLAHEEFVAHQVVTRLPEDWRFVVVEAQCLSLNRLFLVDTLLCRVHPVLPPKELGEHVSLKLLDVSGRALLVAASDAAHFPRVFRTEVKILVELRSDEPGEVRVIFDTWVPVNLPWKEESELWSAAPQLSRLKFRGHEHGSDVESCEAWLLSPPCPRGPAPLVVCPHGGPHSVFSTAWSAFPFFFAHCGFAVLVPNYRGSRGFGEDFLRALPGHVGDYDVNDCKTALATVLATNSKLDPSRVFAFGGSHGGFLTTHLLAQFPGSARNPVTNVLTTLFASDIPDWAGAVTGHGFHEDAPATVEALQAMWDNSPIRRAKDVKAPLLLLLGDHDRRVPPAQGFEFARILAARGVPTRVQVYPGAEHNLAKSVESEGDGFVQTALWFARHGDLRLAL